MPPLYSREDLLFCKFTPPESVCRVRSERSYQPVKKVGSVTVFLRTLKFKSPYSNPVYNLQAFEKMGPADSEGPVKVEESQLYSIIKGSN